MRDRQRPRCCPQSTTMGHPAVVSTTAAVCLEISPLRSVADASQHQVQWDQRRSRAHRHHCGRASQNMSRASSSYAFAVLVPHLHFFAVGFGNLSLVSWSHLDCGLLRFRCVWDWICANECLQQEELAARKESDRDWSRQQSLNTSHHTATKADI